MHGQWSELFTSAMGSPLTVSLFFTSIRWINHSGSSTKQWVSSLLIWLSPVSSSSRPFISNLFPLHIKFLCCHFYGCILRLTSHLPTEMYRNKYIHLTCSINNVSCLRSNEAQGIMLCAYKHQNCWRTPSAGHKWQLGCKHTERVSPFASEFLQKITPFHFFTVILKFAHLFFFQEGSFVRGLVDQRRLGSDGPTVLHLLVLLHSLTTPLIHQFPTLSKSLFYLLYLSNMHLFNMLPFLLIIFKEKMQDVFCLLTLPDRPELRYEAEWAAFQICLTSAVISVRASHIHAVSLHLK